MNYDRGRLSAQIVYTNGSLSSSTMNLIARHILLVTVVYVLSRDTCRNVVKKLMRTNNACHYLFQLIIKTETENCADFKFRSHSLCKRNHNFF